MNNNFLTGPFEQALARLGGISTLESPASRRALSQAAAEADEMAAERAASRAYLLERFTAAMVTKKASEPATFVKPWPRGVTPTVGQVIGDALACADLTQRVMQLLLDASLGKPVSDEARQLLAEAGARWADSEADAS